MLVYSPKQWFYLTALTAILSACAPKEEIVPLDLMVQLVLEMHLAESIVEHTHKEFQNALQMQGALEDSIFSRYGVSDSLYVRSLHYYAAHPRAFDHLYEAVLDSLHARLRRPDERTSDNW